MGNTLQFKLKATKWRQDSIGRTLVEVLAGRGGVDLKEKPRGRLAKDRVVIVFVLNVIIKHLTREAFLVQT